MYISFYNFNPNVAKTNISKPMNKPSVQNSIQALPCDCVSFSGNSVKLENSDDQTFVDILSQEYNLPPEAKKELEKTISDFLKEYEMSSLEGLSDEKYEDSDDEVILHGKLKDIIMSNAEETDEDELSSYLADELIQRIMCGGNYIPQGRAAHSLEDDTISGFFTMDKDKNFYEAIKDSLRLSPFEIYEFKKIVSEFILKENMKSIPELFSGIETAESQAVLMEKLTEKFNLSATVADAVHWEFLMRSDSEKKIGYRPTISRYIQEEDSVKKIVNDYGCASDDSFNYFTFFKVMSEDAKKNGFDSVFEIIKNKDKFEKSKTYAFINNSKLTDEQKSNLIIGLYEAAKDPKAFASQIPKDPEADRFYAGERLLIMADKLAKEFGFDIESESGRIFFEDVQDILCKIYPEHINGGENKSNRQVAHEIIFKYDLSSDSVEEIEKIISECLALDRKAVDKYIVSRMLSGAKDNDI